MPRCSCPGGSCACKVQAGPGITVTGIGTQADPYVITSLFDNIADAIQFDDSPTVTFTVIGDGTPSDPLIVSAAAGGSSEFIRDTMAAALVAGTNVTITPNDAGDTITIASTGGGGGSGLVEDPSDPGFYLIDEEVTPPSNLAPSVTLGVSQTDLLVVASFTGSDPNGDTVSYSIAWGDGATTASATSPSSHTYAAGGTYTIVITVSDGTLASTDSAVVTVTPPAGPSFGSTVLADNPVSAFLMQDVTEPILDSKGVMSAAEATGSLLVGQNQAIGSVTRSVYFSTFGGALYLNLTPDSAIMDGWPAFTIEALIRPDRTTTTRYIIAKDNGSTNRSYRLGHSSTGKLIFGFHGAGSTTGSITGATTMVDNGDYHVVATYDGTTVRLYVNGVEDASGTRSGVTPTIAVPHTLGWRTGSEHYRGWFAGLAFYDKVLTPAEVADHASAAGLLA